MTLALLTVLLLQKPPAPATNLTKLQSQLRSVCDSLHGRMGYSLKILKTGQTLSYRGDERFPSASTIKTGVMVAAFREIDAGKLKLSDKHGLPPKELRQASMWSYFLKEDIKLDVDGWTNLMITVSDNTATIALRDWLGTMKVNEHLEAIGLANTKILGNAPKNLTNIQRLRSMFGMGMTTPNEMNRLFQMILEHKAASPAACDRMLRILSHQYWDDYIGSTIPPYTRIANKTGAISRSRSDCAIVFARNPYILTIYTDNQKDQSWKFDNEGEEHIRKAAKLIYQALNPNDPYEMPKGAEKFWPTGGGVEE